MLLFKFSEFDTRKAVSSLFKEDLNLNVHSCFKNYNESEKWGLPTQCVHAADGIRTRDLQMSQMTAPMNLLENPMSLAP